MSSTAESTKSIISENQTLTRMPSRQLKPSKEHVEERVFTKFTVLKDKAAFRNYFSSYDFRENEKDMIDFWKDVLLFYYETLFETYAIKVNDILSYSKFQNKNPIGLENILLDLNLQSIYVTETDLKSDAFYQKHFLDLYPAPSSWSSYLTSGVSKLVSFVYSSSQDPSTLPPLNKEEMLINFSQLQTHCNEVITTLKQHSEIKDTQTLRKSELKALLTESNDVQYGSSHLDICLLFLEKTKRIKMFNVKVENVEIECVKILNDKNDSVTQRDEVEITLNNQINNLEKKINEIQKLINNMNEKAKEQLRLGKKKEAKVFLARKKGYNKQLESFRGAQGFLEQNLFDIKTMESNKAIKEVLEGANKVAKELVFDQDKLIEEIEDAKNTLDNNNEINKIFENYAKMNDNDVEEELKAIENEQDEFPSAQENTSEISKEEKNLVNEIV